MYYYRKDNLICSKSYDSIEQEINDVIAKILTDSSQREVIIIAPYGKIDAIRCYILDMFEENDININAFNQIITANGASFYIISQPHDLKFFNIHDVIIEEPMIDDEFGKDLIKALI